MSSTERYEDDIKRAILLYKIAKQNGSMEATRVGYSLNFKYLYTLPTFNDQLSYSHINIKTALYNLSL